MRRIVVPQRRQGKAAAIVNPVALLEVARITVGADEVAQARAAGADRLTQRELDRGHQLGALFERDLAGRLARIDARDKQAFARIDVADAHDAPRIHEEELDRDARAAGERVQVRCVERAR